MIECLVLVGCVRCAISSDQGRALFHYQGKEADACWDAVTAGGGWLCFHWDVFSSCKQQHGFHCATKKRSKNNGQLLPSDLCPSLPPSLPFQLLIKQKWPTDHFKLLYQWLTDRNGALPPFLAGPVQHKLTHNEGRLNGGLSLTGKPSITRQYTNDHLRQSHSTAMSMRVQHAHSHSNTHVCTHAVARARINKTPARVHIQNAHKHTRAAHPVLAPRL